MKSHRDEQQAKCRRKEENRREFAKSIKYLESSRGKALEKEIVNMMKPITEPILEIGKSIIILVIGIPLVIPLYIAGHIIEKIEDNM